MKHKSKAAKVIESLDEQLGLDLLKADLGKELKKVGFTDQEAEKIKKAAPKYIKGDVGWSTFLKDSEVAGYAKSALGMQTKKMKALSYYMARLKHKV